MTECHKCLEHSGIVKELAAIRLLIDEREKQASIHLHSYERAVEVEKTQLEVTRQQMERRLALMNEYQKLDKLEGTFATKIDIVNVKDSFDKDFKSISRLVYIGVGIAVALQVLIKFL